MMTDYEAAEKFVAWIQNRIQMAGDGSESRILPTKPSGKFWLSRIASEQVVQENGLTERNERLEPCAIGVRLKPRNPGAFDVKLTVTAVIWRKLAKDQWEKSDPFIRALTLRVDPEQEVQEFGESELSEGLENVLGAPGARAKIRIECEQSRRHGLQVSFLLVNISDSVQGRDQCH